MAAELEQPDPQSSLAISVAAPWQLKLPLASR